MLIVINITLRIRFFSIYESGRSCGQSLKLILSTCNNSINLVSLAFIVSKQMARQTDDQRDRLYRLVNAEMKKNMVLHTFLGGEKLFKYKYKYNI